MHSKFSPRNGRVKHGDAHAKRSIRYLLENSAKEENEKKNDEIKFEINSHIRTLYIHKLWLLVRIN